MANFCFVLCALFTPEFAKDIFDIDTKHELEQGVDVNTFGYSFVAFVATGGPRPKGQGWNMT